MKVACYIRVGRKNDEFDNAVYNQKHNLINYCNKQNYELVNMYVDEGSSGTSIRKRKALNQLIKDSEGNDFEMIITNNISNLTRSTNDFLNLTRIFKENNKKVFFLSNDMEAQELSDLNRVILNVVAEEEESKLISKKVKSSKTKENRK